MILIELTGGLGNQMFQYALGRNLSLRHMTDLVFDITRFESQPLTDTQRSFELDVFDIPGSVANISLLKVWGKPNKYKLFLNTYLHLGLDPYPKNFIKEYVHEYSPEILELPDNVYLSGYWQSEKYFKDIRSIILEDFSKRITPISSKNAKLKSDISKSESVSVHVRRTDYITNPNANAFHGVCDIAYYQRAMQYIEKIVKKPVYFVFSDDPDWAKENIKSKHKMVYISHNRGRDAHEDIRLMSLCQHNIIANSSFSWWGAWLNKNHQKMVISPIKWFVKTVVKDNELIPLKWIKI